MTTGQTSGGHVRFPDYDVVGQASAWDAVTAGIVLARLVPARGMRFFSAEEEATLRPLVDRLLAQDDEPKIPVAEIIDARLAEAQTDGWRHVDMPEDGEAWRRSIRSLDDHAEQSYSRRFADLDTLTQRRLLESVRTANDWYGLPAERVWNLWMRYACAAFYSHPWAWNEIGFGGPAYPRGYANLGLDKREHWERPEAHPRDPEPWARRVERARQRHAGGSG